MFLMDALVCFACWCPGVLVWCGVRCFLGSSGSRVGPWEDIPVSDWISRRLGERVPRMMHVASSGKKFEESDSDADDVETPRETYVINEEVVDAMDVSVPQSPEDLKLLEEWVKAKQNQLIAERTNPVVGKRRGSEVVITMTNSSDSALDDDTIARLNRIESQMGPRLKRTHGNQLAWLVGGLRPGTWHSFRVSASNSEGEGPMCAPTGFIRTFGTWPFLCTVLCALACSIRRCSFVCARARSLDWGACRCSTGRSRTS
jgi:hypothetical protein